MSKGTGRVYKRGNIYWIQYGHRGKTYRESSESTRKKDAIKLLDQRKAERAIGKVTGPDAERVTYEDLAEMIETDYTVNRRKSIRRLRTSLKNLKGYFVEWRALDITTDAIRRYIAHRQDDGVSNATIRNELAALKRAFRLAVQAGHLPQAPHIPAIRVSNRREGFLDGADLEAVIAELPEPADDIARFAALTGWRKSEILPLTWSAVDFDAGVLHLWKSKTDEPRAFPFRVLPPLAELLERRRGRTKALEKDQGRIIPHVFHRDGEPVKSIRSAWEGATERAGVPDAWFHDLRRTAIRNFERAGISRSVGMSLSGHKTDSIYRRYAIVDAAAQAEGVEKLAKLYETRGDTARKVVPLKEAATGG